VHEYNILEGIREGGAFLLNSAWSVEEMESKLPDRMKRSIVQKKLDFYNIDAVKIASELGLGGRINMIMQAAFFQIANVIPPQDAFQYIKEAVEKTYGKKGQEIVRMNMAAVDGAVGALKKIEVPSHWATAGQESYIEKDEPEFVEKVMRPSKEISCR
jgi:pyruvate-ferredoxin/flavodoxin oxidoreductase